MARTGRPGLSHEHKDKLWRRWKAGETLSDIGRALGKHAASVFGVVAAKGGFAPMPRSRKSGSLSLIEREEISRGLVEGRSGSLAEIWGGLFPRSAVKSPAMAGAGAIVPPGLTSGRRIAHAVPSPASWHLTRPCANW